MKKTVLYTYYGTNGLLTTPIHLEGIYSTIQYRLEAEDGKMMTNGTITKKMVTVSESELDEWKEVYNMVSSK